MKVRRQIAEKARHVREAAAQNKPPIDVQSVAQSLGLDVSMEPFKEELSGVLIKEDRRTVIGVNSSHSRTRQRFTIAHEIGHFVLEHKGDIFVDQTVRARSVTIGRRDSKASLGIEPNEIEANAFAAELLMPEDWVLHAVEKSLKGSQDVRPEQLVAELAKRFLVSTEAMQHRLTNLGLFIPQ